MIKANTPQLESIVQRLMLITSDCEDILSLVRRIGEETENDFELAAYPQASAVCESVSSAVASLSRANELLQGLKSALAFAGEEYEQTERRQIDAVSRMTVLLSEIKVNLAAAEAPGQIAAEERNDQTERDALVARLVAGSAAELQIANLAALGKAVEEEYGKFTATDFGAETEVKP